jgi:mannose-6-phosphate isomerase
MKTFNYIEKEKRPWGIFYVIHNLDNYKIKRLEINPGHRLSYQFHEKRSETWIIIKGNPYITIDDINKQYKEGDTIIIPVKSKHRIENRGNQDIVLIEIQTGDYFGEDDIVRIDDDYSRI